MTSPSELQSDNQTAKEPAKPSDQTPPNQNIDRWRTLLRSGKKQRDILTEMAGMKKDPEDVNKIDVVGRTDLSGGIQRARRKRNIIYTTSDGTELFAKSARRIEGSDTQSALVQEAQMLDRLEGSGVTPKLIDIKVYPNGQKTRIVLEGVKGRSLDRKVPKGSEDLLKKHSQEVLIATAQALDTVHKAGVLVVDVNEGTFILEGEQTGSIDAKVVDFEFAIDPKTTEQAEIDDAIDWFKRKDLGFKQAAEKGIKQEDLTVALSRAEIHLWAKSVSEWLLGPPWGWNDNLKGTDAEQYNSDKNAMLPSIQERVMNHAQTDANMLFNSTLNRDGDKTLEQFTQAEFQRKLPAQFKKELMSTLLEHNLKLKGINISNKTVNFLKMALSPNINARPDSFDALLN